MHTTDAAAFWDRQIVNPTLVTWMEPLPVREYINTSISGSPNVWPIEWLEQVLNGRTFANALSVGCGGGPLERQLLQRNVCVRMDAFDGSAQSIAVANEEAAKAGIADRVHYSVGDFNAPRLPVNAYDAVFFHMSMHHVGWLEKLLRAVLRSLRPDGILYLDEYIGPSRHEWTDALIAAQRAIYQSLPAEFQKVTPLPYPILVADPSEAARSSEIMREVRRGFDIEHFRPYGGNVLSVVFESIDWSRPGAEALLPGLIEQEKSLLARGASPFHAVVIARPKRGLAAAAASAGYWFVPKAKRVLRAIRGGV